MSQALRPLYAMAKFSLEEQARIMALFRASRIRPPDLLHMTLLGFVDLARPPDGFSLSALLATLNGFEANPFDVVFDTIVERKAVTLRSSSPLTAARAFQRKLVDFLKRRGFPYFGEAPVPHVTINYHGDGRGDQRIDPIAFRIEEVLLIESITGKTQHEPRGRLPLNRLLF